MDGGEGRERRCVRSATLNSLPSVVLLTKEGERRARLFTTLNSQLHNPQPGLNTPKESKKIAPGKDAL